MDNRPKIAHQSYRASGALAGTIFFSVLPLILLVGGIGAATSTSTRVFGVFMIVVAILFMCWSWLFMRRKGVYLGADGVTIRGSLRVRRACWGDIDNFSIETGPFGVVSFLLYLDPGNVRGYVNLQDGSRIVLTGLRPVRRQRANRTREELSRTIEELNKAREAYSCIRREDGAS